MKKKYIAYITAGHPNLSYTVDAAIALAKGGVDILEIGVPFSDPIADGPVIQTAMQQALAQGVTVVQVCELIQEIRKTLTIPIVLFTYLNPLMAYGISESLALAKSAGVDAILCVDLPLEENHEVVSAAQQLSLDLIGLISPTTSAARITAISAISSRFLYYVCRNGTTGVRQQLPSDFSKNIQQIQAISTLPVVAGFGIGDRTQAAQALVHADGFVVGSAFVKAMQSGISPAALTQLAITIDPRGEQL